MENVDGKLMLQGAEDGSASDRDGVGWTMAIAQDSGKTVLTSSGDEVAFIVFGACSHTHDLTKGAIAMKRIVLTVMIVGPTWAPPGPAGRP